MNMALSPTKSAICAEQVAVADVDRIWPLIADDVVKCLKKTPTYFTAGDLWTMCRTGNVFLLAVHDGLKIQAASVWQFEGQKFVCLLLVGNHSDEWITALFEKAAEMARNGGAVQLMASGRVGLGAKLKKHLPSLRVIRHTYTVEV
jgi:hypothetical protein